FRWEAFVEDFEIPEQSRWNAREPFPLKLLHVRVDVIYKNDKNGKLYRLNCLKPVGLRPQSNLTPFTGVPSPAGITPGIRNPNPRPFQ
ncbi:MAG TPA: hypothetical protein VGQ81_11430, partial [Acidobacteriota bacterium]|nr:hypothetical protein [Acidobacteriota bacterium]